MDKRKELIRDMDYLLFLVTLVICIFGLVILRSASLSLATGNRIMRSQIIATGLGFVAMIVVSLIDYRVWKLLYKPIYVISVALLVATLVFGVEDYGAKSWLNLGFINFQPSEFVKLGLIISLAAYLEDVQEELNKPLVLIKVLAFALLPVVLIMFQPDAGTAMVYMFFIITMLFIAGISWKYIISSAVAVVVSAPVVWMFLLPHQRNRILDFLNPTENITTTGYQYLQGEIAIGSGKITGKGLFQGSQTQFNFIPLKQNDFIFPVLAEELGFLGGFALIALYGFLILRLYKISRESVDTFGSLLVIGVAALLLFHIWENIGMTLGVMPITGIPLPFFSAGGTFQLLNLGMMGLALSVAAHKNIKYF